ncbi:hypothetical protein BDV27DRAFT_129907 [Aspergillus caelatus]|uniref:Uncharacterized protein n=1 Tax=Aspergillus caelatus TaxID=61420 RepID=A0A5N7A1A8_9EURO|nr:uncharacterized protein BDV27DRAFT_129907 [Aspergillus caelatus]KAE8363475.1 hypothetical protein BDV27DRAFT_129907 [Aspergillus caelatus]
MVQPLPVSPVVGQTFTINNGLQTPIICGLNLPVLFSIKIRKPLIFHRTIASILLFE